MATKLIDQLRNPNCENGFCNLLTRFIVKRLCQPWTYPEMHSTKTSIGEQTRLCCERSWRLNKSDGFSMAYTRMNVLHQSKFTMDRPIEFCTISNSDRSGRSDRCKSKLSLSIFVGIIYSSIHILEKVNHLKYPLLVIFEM